MRRKGFVTTLEAILAATIFLIFLVNVLPNFVSTGAEGDTLERQADTVVRSLDRAGELRDQAVARNLSGIEDDLDSYINGVNLAVGLSWTNRTDGQVTSTPADVLFETNTSQIERERLLLWVDEVTDLTIEVNQQQVATIDSTGFHEVSIEDETEQGQNNLTFDASSVDLAYTIEQYYYVQSQELPDVDRIYGTGYMMATNSTANEPHELQVYLWR